MAYKYKIFLFFMGCWIFGACSVHEVDQMPAPVIEARTYNSIRSIGAPVLRAYWESFGDKTLNELVSKALDKNFEISAAVARLEQARELGKQGGALLLPTLEARAEAGRSRTAFRFGSVEQTTETNRFVAQGVLSYELDLWGRLRSLKDAAEREVEATYEDLQDLALVISGEVTRTWISLIEQRALVALREQQLTTNQDNLELIELRFEKSEASALDVLQQRQLVRESLSELPQARASVRVLMSQLSVLLGEAPGKQTQAIPRVLPLLPELPKSGLPAHLLQSRPDLRALRLRLIAADERVAAAIADRLPSLRLSADIGTQSFEPSGLFREIVGSALASITGPLFDGGRRASIVKERKAIVRERVAQYSQAFLNAIQEVEEAAIRERATRKIGLELAARLALAKETLIQARQRYESGLSDYLPVLTARRSQQALELQSLTTNRELLEQRLRLFLALGGEWTRELKPEIENKS